MHPAAPSRPATQARAAASLAMLTAAEAAGTLGLWTVGQSLGARVRDPAASGQVDAVVGIAAAAAAWAVLSWLVAGCVLALLAHLWAGRPGDRGRLARRCADATPRLARRVVAVLLGLGLGAATGSAAAAAPAATNRPAAPAVHAPPVAADLADRPAAPAARGPAAEHSRLAGWSPDRPAPAPRYDPTGARLVAGPVRAEADRPGGVAGDVVVRAGDTLWDIAARHLHRSGPADAAEIAAEWPRWYAANRAAIGPDPDRLLPGQRLRIPS